MLVCTADVTSENLLGDGVARRDSKTCEKAVFMTSPWPIRALLYLFTLLGFSLYKKSSDTFFFHFAHHLPLIFSFFDFFSRAAQFRYGKFTFHTLKSLISAPVARFVPVAHSTGRTCSNENVKSPNCDSGTRHLPKLGVTWSSLSVAWKLWRKAPGNPWSAVLRPFATAIRSGRLAHFFRLLSTNNHPTHLFCPIFCDIAAVSQGREKFHLNDMDFQSVGFYKCTVAKCMIVASLITAIVYHTLRYHEYSNLFVYGVQRIVHDKQVFRLITGKVIFLNPHELICSNYLLFNFRIFERRFGSAKFLCFVFFAWFISSLLELICISLMDAKTAPSGIHWLLFSLSFYYWKDVPVIEHVEIGPMKISQKSFHYLLLLQLAISEDNSTLFACIGLMTGFAHYYDILALNQWMLIPPSIRTSVGFYAEKMLGSSSPKTELMGATLSVQRQMRQEELERRMVQMHIRRTQGRRGDAFGFLSRMAGRRDARAANYSEESVTSLTAMGFQREEAINALRLSNNDVSSAAAMLSR